MKILVKLFRNRTNAPLAAALFGDRKMSKEIDISKMYCNSKSDSFYEFCRIARESYGEECYSFLMSKKDSKIGVDCAASSFNNTGGYCPTRHWYAREFGFTEFRTDIKWSIYTNDKPLSELSDEQAAELFNWWRNGGDVEYKGHLNDDWCCIQKSNNVINVSSAYRAKQKSERELFVETAVNTYDGRTGLSELAMSLAAGIIFDSGKFKLVEQ